MPPEDVIVFKDPDPANPYGRGSGIGKALGDELDTDEFAAQHIENAPLLKRIHVGDGDHQKQKQFAILQYRVFGCGSERSVMPGANVGDT